MVWVSLGILTSLALVEAGLAFMREILVQDELATAAALRGGGGFYYFDSELAASSRGALINTGGFPADYVLGVSGFGPFIFGGAAIGTTAFEPWWQGFVLTSALARETIRAGQAVRSVR